MHKAQRSRRRGQKAMGKFDTVGTADADGGGDVFVPRALVRVREGVLAGWLAGRLAGEGGNS